jgi:TonB family protein
LRYLVIICLVGLSLVAQGQLLDTLYYNNNWQLVKEGNETYYRVAGVNQELLQFTGKFTDYFKNGQILCEGQYSSSGKKNGIFTHYYRNGNIYSRGAYDDDFFTGKWTYYYSNGTLKEQINFDQGRFVVAEQIDSLGNIQVKDGTGKWQREIKDGGTTYTLHATFRDYRRSGNWTLRFPDLTVFLKESYEYGKFIKGYEAGYPPKYYEETKFLDDIFYPERFFIIESFSVWEAAREDYPYISWLSQMPLEGVATEYSIDSLSRLGPQLEIPDKRAEYPGGRMAFFRKISSLLVYPPGAKKAGVAGTVYIQFVIGLDGNISSIQVLKGIGGGCDQEAILAILGAGKWLPAQKLGQPIEQKIIIPISFYPPKNIKEN